jgi:hypothetical protein
MTQPRTWRPSARLVQHDIGFEVLRARGRSSLRVLVDCERRGAPQTIDTCRSCERFARIEAHEAGYVLLCRSQDETFEPIMTEAPEDDA